MRYYLISLKRDVLTYFVCLLSFAKIFDQLEYGMPLIIILFLVNIDMKGRRSYITKDANQFKCKLIITKGALYSYFL